MIRIRKCVLLLGVAFYIGCGGSPSSSSSQGMDDEKFLASLGDQTLGALPADQKTRATKILKDFLSKQDFKEALKNANLAKGHVYEENDCKNYRDSVNKHIDKINNNEFKHEFSSDNAMNYLAPVKPKAVLSGWNKELTTNKALAGIPCGTDEATISKVEIKLDADEAAAIATYITGIVNQIPSYKAFAGAL